MKIKFILFGYCALLPKCSPRVYLILTGICGTATVYLSTSGHPVWAFLTAAAAVVSFAASIIMLIPAISAILPKLFEK